jgi:mono/diheme cytochrome c family protein
VNQLGQTVKTRRPALWTTGAVALLALGFGAYLIIGPGPTDFARGKRVPLAEYRGADPTGVPTELKSASLVKRGEYLARAADCLVCHTAKDGTAFIGGRAFSLPFGTLYSTNITPDADTGIGGYTDEDFRNALRKGVGRGGRRLYPAMPYTSYAYISDEDASAIKAYLFSLKPIHAPTPVNTLTFPFNQRALMGAWSAVFNPDRRYEPNTGQSAQWNRGAYLAEAMEHCGECHTPRNLFFALDNRRKFAGTVQAGWRAYNITQDATSGIGTWSEQEISDYLAYGHAAGRGTASGPMGEVVDESVRYLTASDVRAMVTYLRSVTPTSDSALPAPKLSPAPASHGYGVDGNPDPRGKVIYAGACAGCHGWTGITNVVPLASLTGARAVNDPGATNVVQVIIHGGQRDSSDPTVSMPPFGDTYTDAEVASVANYVTGRYGAHGSALTPQRVAELREAD